MPVSTFRIDEFTAACSNAPSSWRGWMMRRLFRVAVALALVSLPRMAAAETLQVNDASQLKWSIYAGKAYFRNFNEIEGSWQGCCYAYYIDLSTDEGKAMFSVFLTRNAARQPITFWVVDKTANPSQIAQVGDW